MEQILRQVSQLTIKSKLKLFNNNIRWELSAQNLPTYRFKEHGALPGQAESKLIVLMEAWMWRCASQLKNNQIHSETRPTLRGSLSSTSRTLGLHKFWIQMQLLLGWIWISRISILKLFCKTILKFIAIQNWQIRLPSKLMRKPRDSITKGQQG